MNTDKQRHAKKIAQYEKTVDYCGGHTKFAARYGLSVASSLECAKDAFNRNQSDAIVADFLYSAAKRFSDNNGGDCLFSEALCSA